MKYPTDQLSEAEKLELTRERNRKKQSALRQRRAARVAELEAENAKLARSLGTSPLPIPKKGARSSKRPSSSPPHQPVASTSGTSGGQGSEGDEREVWAPTRSDEEVARLTGAVGRLVGRLREFGVGEAEIGRLIAGRNDGSDAGTKLALPHPGTSSVPPSPYHQQTSLHLPRLPPIPSSHTSYAPSPQSGSTEESSVFPFAFLFADNNATTSFSHSSTFDSQPNASSSASSPLTPLPLTASHTPNSLSRPHSPRVRSSLMDVVMGESPRTTPHSDPSTLLHQLADLATIDQPPTVDDDTPLNKQLSPEWQKKLFEINATYGAQQLGGDRMETSDAAAVVSEELAASTQLLILRLLGETSSQKRLYDDERVMSQEDRAYLESAKVDKRLQFFPDPLARVTIARASESGQQNLTVMLSELIDQTTIYGDVWDVTGWKLPSLFCSKYPAVRPQTSLALAGGFFAAPRPIPATLRGASIREIVLGTDPTASRESGPFIVDTVLLSVHTDGEGEGEMVETVE